MNLKKKAVRCCLFSKLRIRNIVGVNSILSVDVTVSYTYNIWNTILAR